MAVGLAEYSITYPSWYDEHAEWERQSKGYLQEVEVRLTDGPRFQLFFYDPVRLTQELEAYVKSGTSYLSEPNMVVIPEITRAAIEAAIAALVASKSFSQFKPLD